MLKNNYICALDIGESKIAAALAEVSRRGEITDLALESSASRGIERGVIVNSIEFSTVFGNVLKKLRERTGLKVKDLHINVASRQIVSRHSNAIVPLSERGNKVITDADIKNVIEQARILGSNLEEEIIHQIPFSYTIDGLNKVSDPQGLYGHRLEVDLFLVCAHLSFLQTLIRAVNQAGYEIKDMCFSGFINNRILFSPDSQNSLNVICDIGADTTEITVFNNGILQAVEILSVGGNDITRRLAKELDIHFDLANSVKESHGSVLDAGSVADDKEVMVKKGSAYKSISQKAILEIIHKESQLIYRAIKEKLSQLLSERKIDNFVILGRTALMDGFIEAMEQFLGFEVKLGRVMHSKLSQRINKDFTSSSLKVLTYINALAMIQNGINQSKNSPSKDLARLGPVSRIFTKAKEVYQEYF